MSHEEELPEFPLSIFRGSKDAIPSTADAFVISLPAKIEDSLDWKAPRETALKLSGLKIVFELDFGLFKSLALPLDDNMQFQSLSLACRELRKLVQEIEISGVILGYIQAEELFELRWTESEREGFIEWAKSKFEIDVKPELAAITPEGRLLLKLYALEIHAHFLNLLGDELVDSCPTLLLIDCTNISGSLENLLLHSQELFEPIECILKNSGFFTLRPILKDLDSGECIELPSNFPEKRMGVLVPSLQKAKTIDEYHKLLQLLQSLEGHELFAIPEESINTSWDELEWLFMGSAPTNLETNRSIKGFIAAGGRVATLSELPSFHKELNL